MESLLEEPPQEWLPFISGKIMVIFSRVWNRGLLWTDLVYLIVFELVAIYIYLKWEQGYFDKRGIKSLPFSVPFIGQMMGVLRGKELFKDYVLRHYQAYPDEKYIGIRQFNKSLIQLRDLDLIKHATITNFESFINRHIVVDERTDTLIGSNLFSLRGEKWRDMRVTLTPAFTTTKMKTMFQFMVEVSEQLVSHYQEKMKEPDSKEKGYVDTEMRDSFARFTNDVIASISFGHKVDSLKEPQNEFFLKARIATHFGGIQQVKLLLFMTFPWIFKMGLIKIFDKKLKDYFVKLVLGNMRQREEHGIVRKDFIHQLCEIRKGSLEYNATKNEDSEVGFATAKLYHVGKRNVRKDWSDDDIVAQALQFFFAGFTTTSTMFCFMAYELAANPDIQSRLQEEIDDIVARKGGLKLDYSDLVSMKYMDMVVSETLRKWPPALSPDRLCTKAYTLPPSKENGESYTIQPGEGITIPIYGIHHDPKYFPEPEKFDPERFSDENKHKIVSNSFIPFGIGPRSCIASRFALMEAKVAIFYLLANFDIIQTPKSTYPLKISSAVFLLTSADGFKLGVRPRNLTYT